MFIRFTRGTEEFFNLKLNLKLNDLDLEAEIQVLKFPFKLKASSHIQRSPKLLRTPSQADKIDGEEEEDE